MGWFPWQLTAASDLLLAIALVATPWIPRLPAVLTLLITIAAIVPDQTGQALWITRGVTLAREAVASGAFDAYASFELRTFHWIAGWATVGYLLGALGWTWCFAAARAWSRALTWLSLVMWSIFALVTATLFMPTAHRPSAVIVSAGNAIGFLLLMIWLIAVRRRILARDPSAARSA
jgi:ABC-type methionine transport system permease subunit